MQLSFVLMGGAGSAREFFSFKKRRKNRKNIEIPGNFLVVFENTQVNVKVWKERGRGNSLLIRS